MRLGELLLDSGTITQEQLDQAIAEQRTEGGFIGQILVRHGYVSQEQVASCLVKQCKIPHLSLLDYDIGQDVLSLVPEEVCRQYKLLPIDKLGRILTVAMVDPLDLEALEAVRAHCSDLRIKPILCNWEHFEHVAARLFKKSDGRKTDVDAKSFGFTDRLPPEQPEPQPEPAPAPEPVDHAPSPAGIAPPAETVAPPAAVPAADPQLITGAIRDGMRDALAEVVKTLHGQSPAAAPAPAGPSAEDLALAFRDAMSEAMETMASRMPASSAAPAPAAPPAPAGPNAQEMAEIIRDSVGGALQEGMAAIVVQLRAQQPAGGAAPAGPSPEQMGHAIEQSVRAAMEQAMSGLATQIDDVRAAAQAVQAHAVQSEPAPAPPAPQTDPAQLAEQLSHAMRDSVGGAIQEAMATLVVQLRSMQGRNQQPAPEELAQVLQTSVVQAVQASQEATSAQLREITAAAMQSVQQVTQLVETAAVTEQNRRDLEGKRRQRHLSVTPFGGPANGGEQHAESDARLVAAMESEKPIEAFTFQSYFPGKANTFTYRISQAVAHEPGGEYNPFFLYGEVGIGKTHLISAIGNHVLANGAQLRTGYVSASHFARRLNDAKEAGALDAFRENYCHWDVLILDDIQFMGGRVEAQEEFFHIFNVLRENGRQIVIAGDKAPDRLGLLEQRLVSRFASGIVTQLKAPEWETRVQILRHHAERQGAQVPEEIVSLIAMRVPNDIRKMVGSLRKVIAFANLVGQEMSCELAEEILNHLGAEQAA